MENIDGYPADYKLNSCLSRRSVTDREIETWSYILEEEMDRQNFFHVAYGIRTVIPGPEKERFIFIQ